MLTASSSSNCTRQDPPRAGSVVEVLLVLVVVPSVVLVAKVVVVEEAGVQFRLDTLAVGVGTIGRESRPEASITVTAKSEICGCTVAVSAQLIKSIGPVTPNRSMKAAPTVPASSSSKLPRGVANEVHSAAVPEPFTETVATG